MCVELVGEFVFGEFFGSEGEKGDNDFGVGCVECEVIYD